ncbi:MAG: orotate phosphoribosyltransferase [Planctomycetes bacterium]|nr:orotate phosphoribosyltransferase [Planctomycetota bacterium]
MNEQDVLKIFENAGALLTGHFKLSSGLHSDRYLQCALVLQHPRTAETLCAALAGRWKGAGIQTVIGPALGGVIVAHEIARALDARCVFMERQGGQMTLRRNFCIGAGESVLVAEDVVTTGGSVREIIRHLQNLGANVAGVSALVDRSGAKPFGDLTFERLLVLDARQYEPDECPLCQAGVPIDSPGSRRL